MSTAAIITPPPMPDSVRESLGLSATQRNEMLEQRRTELEVRGDIKPATLLNLSPFPLDLGGGLIPYTISACPMDPKKKFSVTTITTIRHYPTYKGNEQMADKSIRGKWDVNIVLPTNQLMEFKHYYVGETEEDQASKQGGVIVFEGTADDLKVSTVVREPYFIFRKRNRYTVLRDRVLGDLVIEQEAILKRRCMAMLDQASHWHDNEKSRANIQRPFHIWHDFALMRQWITTALPWRTAHTPAEQRCPRCSAQYVSKTGVCKCSYVYEPFTAYMQSEITVDHVRMNALTQDQWKKVNAEEKRRREARGE